MYQEEWRKELIWGRKNIFLYIYLCYVVKGIQHHPFKGTESGPYFSLSS